MSYDGVPAANSSDRHEPLSTNAFDLQPGPPTEAKEAIATSNPTPLSDIRNLVRSLTFKHTYEKLDDVELGKNENENGKEIKIVANEIHEDDHGEPHTTQEPLPQKRYSRSFRNVRWTLLNVYERLASIVLVVNLVVMIWTFTRSDPFSEPTWFSTPVAVNITLTVLIRNEHVINFLFWSFGKTPKSWPLRVRRIMAKLYHLGGIHSGAGIAGCIWFFLFNGAVLNIQGNEQYNGIRAGVFLSTVALDVLLINILVLSLPQLRARYHNMWEQMHRFAGWTAVLLFWLHLFLFNQIAYRLNGHTEYFETLFTTPNFWLMLTTTFIIISPWFKLRKVPVRAEPLSEHAVRLHFTHQNLPICTTPRFSDQIMKEWHAFAAIPSDDGIGYSVLISKAGDWTTKVIKTPPKELWTKGTPARGALYCGIMFKKIVVVATGSGIAPILSLFHAPGLECKVLWSTPGPPETVFAPYIVDYVKKTDPEAVIINTRQAGRPNLVEEAWNIYQRSGAEAVFIISNAAVTRKFVYGLGTRGVPTFAPIFDS